MKPLLSWMNGIFIFLLISITHTHGQYFSLRVGDVRNTSYTQQGTIEDALLSIKPKGLYLEYGLYLTFSARDCGYKANDSLETVLRFRLPENAVIIDSWLWIGNDICKAAILDVWTASNIYENIVKRRRDPSLLTKNSSLDYTLRVFPMGGNETRKVKITYLVPIPENYGEARISIPYDILNTSRYKPFDLPLLIWENSNWTLNRIESTNFTPILSGLDSLWGSYKTTSVLPINGNYKNDYVVYNTSQKDPVSLGYYPDKSESYYQLSLLPGRFLEDIQSSKVLFLIDYDQVNSPTKEQVLAALKAEIKNNFSPDDSFNIFASHINPQPAFSNWQKCTPENIELAFQLVKDRLAAYSNLPGLINAGILHLNNHGGRGNIVLLNNSTQFNSYLAANSLLAEINQLNTAKYRFSIIDYSTANVYSYFNNRYFYNNEYLLQNLAYLFGGVYKSVRQGYTLEAALAETVPDALPQIQNFDVYVRVNQGITYGKYILSTKQTLPLNRSYKQMGLFRGNFPIVIEMSGELDKKIFNKSITIQESEAILLDSIAKTQWQARSLLALESQNVNGNLTSNIVYKSIEGRILSLYTAFLCLEDSSLYCNNCRDENAFPTADKELVSDSAFQLEIFPNPFVDQVRIELHWKNSNDAVPVKATITDISGRAVRHFEIKNTFKEGIRYFSWDGHSDSGAEVASGLYIVRIQTRSGSLCKKVIKS